MRQNREHLREQEQGLEKEQLETLKTNRPGQSGTSREEVTYEPMKKQTELDEGLTKEVKPDRSDRRL